MRENVIRMVLIPICLLALLSSCAQARTGVSGDSSNVAADPQMPTYRNEALILNAADPFVFRDEDGTYYLYHTGKGFRVYSSTDLVDWTEVGRSMPDEGYAWAVTSFWAPEVIRQGETYLLHYTGEAEDGVKKIGLAASESPTGPFRDVRPEPLLETPPKSVIDSHIFFDDDGRVYMYYSNAMSTNRVGDQRYSEIWVVELESDLSRVKGEPRLLTRPEQEWEYSSGPGDYWNEGAVIHKRRGIYYLMYSANCYCRERYSVGYATADHPMGPFVKYDRNPILSIEPYQEEVSGPGHHSIMFSPDSSEIFMIYHSHMDLEAMGGARKINIDRMGVRADGTMYVNGPTITEQPFPSSDADRVRNIAGEATISASTTEDGHNVSALADGEFSMYDRFKQYEWVADNPGDAVEVRLTWPQSKEISEIWIYNSIDPSRQASTARVVFDNGVETGNIELRRGPGDATVIRARRSAPADGLTVYLSSQGDAIAISEVMVMGWDPDP